jgi:hypothetical protein
MKGQSELEDILEKLICTEKCNKAELHEKRNHKKSLLNYEAREALTCKHLFCWVV